METKILRVDRTNPDLTVLAEAAELLKSGELVAFPTETVYGLGANALDAEACSKIFQVKGRPQDNPLIVHVANRAIADTVIKSWNVFAEICMHFFWPGPLTLVLPKKTQVPATVTCGLETVAIRMPKHRVALALIELTGLPLAAPSANLSGKPSPTSADHVRQDLHGRIKLIIDAGNCQVGLESTVLDLTGKIPTILRPGGITREDLEKVLGEVRVDRPTENQAPKAPGMKYRHYAPNGEMLLVSGSKEEVVSRILKETQKAHGNLKKVGILCTSESAAWFHDLHPELLFVLGSENLPEEVAANLFRGLRLCDEQGIEVILAEGVEESGLGSAIMNRLQKAAGQKIIRL
ncbi:MAG: L-threonylcarbamoyladenylate synthase [Desulfitobacteriaceae bacterium]|nr:L-threonylcarbamoyladenylate synthase [Desulfitobacteriaceae bacterium]